MIGGLLPVFMPEHNAMLSTVASDVSGPSRCGKTQWKLTFGIL